MRVMLFVEDYKDDDVDGCIGGDDGDDDDDDDVMAVAVMTTVVKMSKIYLCGTATSAVPPISWCKLLSSFLLI